MFYWRINIWESLLNEITHTRHACTSHRAYLCLRAWSDQRRNSVAYVHLPIVCKIWDVCSHLLTLVPRSRIFLPWRWRRYIPQKRRLTQDLHGATSQKTTFYTVYNLSQISVQGYICLLCIFLTTGCLGKYLDRREMKWQEVGGNCIMSFIACTLLQV
jgi:hypothetical protein